MKITHRDEGGHAAALTDHPALSDIMQGAGPQPHNDVII